MMPHNTCIFLLLTSCWPLLVGVGKRGIPHLYC